MVPLTGFSPLEPRFLAITTNPLHFHPYSYCKSLAVTVTLCYDVIFLIWLGSCFVYDFKNHRFQCNVLQLLSQCQTTLTKSFLFVCSLFVSIMVFITVIRQHKLWIHLFWVKYSIKLLWEWFLWVHLIFLNIMQNIDCIITLILTPFEGLSKCLRFKIATTKTNDNEILNCQTVQINTVRFL